MGGDSAAAGDLRRPRQGRLEGRLPLPADHAAGRLLRGDGGGLSGVNTRLRAALLLVGGVAGVRPGDFPDAFFFSVETLSTVGYGEMCAQSLYANLVVTVETFCRPVQPSHRHRPPVRPHLAADGAGHVLRPRGGDAYDGEPTLMFRAANRRRNLIVEAEVTRHPGCATRSPRKARGMRGFEICATVRVALAAVLPDLAGHAPDRRGQPAVRRDDREPAGAARRDRGGPEGPRRDLRPDHPRPRPYTPDEIIWGGQLVDIFSARR